jgi:hypothetical protein
MLYVFSFTLIMLAIFAVLLAGMLLVIRHDDDPQDEEPSGVTPQTLVTNVVGVPTLGAGVGKRTGTETGATARR